VVLIAEFQGTNIVKISACPPNHIIWFKQENASHFRFQNNHSTYIQSQSSGW